MGKKRGNDEPTSTATAATETPDERRERKRLKKEENERKRERKRQKKLAKQDKQERQTKSTPADDDFTGDNEGSSSALMLNNEGQDGFWKKSIELTISVLPSALRDIHAYIHEALRSYLLKYSDEIGGILLAFENVKILSDSTASSTVGTIFNELPHIHYRVSTDALVFDPSPGTKLVGSVMDGSFHSHLSLLVNRYFNASVSSEQLRAAGFEFDDVQLQWYWQDSTNALCNGDCIELVCQKLYESGGIISIEGAEPALRSKEI